MNVFHANNLPQTANEYQAVNGTALVQNAFARYPGSWAARVNPSGGATAAFFFGPMGPAGNVSGGNPTTDTYLRTHFAYLVKPAANDEFILRLEAVSGTQFKLHVSLDSQGRLNVFDMNLSLMATGTFAIPTGQFYRLNTHAGTGSNAPWDLQLYDSTETLVSSMSGTGNLNANPCSSGRLGKTQNRFGNTVDYYFTDTLVNDSVAPGPGRGAMLLPYADGFYTQAVPRGGGPQFSWQCVDEVPILDIDFARMSAVGAYTAKVGSAVTGTINTVKSYARMRAGFPTGINPVCAVRLRSGATDSDTTGAIPSPALYSQKLHDVDPKTGLPWTPDAVNVLEVGGVNMPTSNGGIDIMGAYVLVDYFGSPSAVGHFYGRDDTTRTLRGVA